MCIEETADNAFSFPDTPLFHSVVLYPICGTFFSGRPPHFNLLAYSIIIKQCFAIPPRNFGSLALPFSFSSLCVLVFLDNSPLPVWSSLELDQFAGQPNWANEFATCHPFRHDMTWYRFSWLMLQCDVVLVLSSFVCVLSSLQPTGHQPGTIANHAWGKLV